MEINNSAGEEGVYLHDYFRASNVAEVSYIVAVAVFLVKRQMISKFFTSAHRSTQTFLPGNDAIFSRRLYLVSNGGRR